MTTNQLLETSAPATLGSSLRAATPEAGLHLAVQVARAARHATGEDEVPATAEMADYLRQPSASAAAVPSPSAQLVLSSFAIVAAANNYWL